MKLTFKNLLYGNIFDKYSIVHIISGIYISLFLYLTKNKNIFLVGLIIHTLYELKDFLITYEIINYKHNKFFNMIWATPNNYFLNSIGDTILFIFGYLIFTKLIKNGYNFNIYNLITLLLLNQSLLLYYNLK